MPTLGIRMPAFCHPMGKCFCNPFCCFFFVATERSPETLIEVNLGLCGILERLVFLDRHQ